MDNLIKALKCEAIAGTNACTKNCLACKYYQDEHKEVVEILMTAAYELSALEKSNRNWRRKAQRLRKELKEAKENGVS